jgi:transcriptional regulator with XRE-family HTH domain
MIEPAPWHALGAQLQHARRRTSLTQHHIARQIGISQAAYSQIERGLVRPRPAHLLQLAVVLGLGLDRLAVLADYPLERVLVTGTTNAQ